MSPETHPPLGGIYGNTTGGQVVIVITNGDIQNEQRDGAVVEPTTGGSYDQTTTGGEVY